jgi:hypothetical protein
VKLVFFGQKSLHLSSDIPTFMLNNEKIRKHLNVPKVFKGNPSSSRKKRGVPVEIWENCVDKLRHQLEGLLKSLRKIQVSGTTKTIERENEKIVKKYLSVSLRKDFGNRVDATVAVLSTCVSTLLGVKSSALSLEENLLLHLVHDALKAYNAKDVVGNMLQLLLSRLSNTLFKDCLMSR